MITTSMVVFRAGAPPWTDDIWSMHSGTSIGSTNHPETHPIASPADLLYHRRARLVWRMPFDWRGLQGGCRPGSQRAVRHCADNALAEREASLIRQ